MTSANQENDMNTRHPVCRIYLAPHFLLWVALEQAVLLWLGQDLEIASVRFTLVEASIFLWFSAATARILMDTRDHPPVPPLEAVSGTHVMAMRRATTQA